MGDSDQGVDRAVAGADSGKWNFSIMAGGAPWRVEQGMTRLLAHQGAEGFAPSLAAAAREDALVIHELGRRETPTAVAALRAFQAMSPVDTQRELAQLHAERLVRQGVPDPSWASSIGRVRAEGCWWAHDPFDETAFVLSVFSYDGADEHGTRTGRDRPPAATDPPARSTRSRSRPSPLHHIRTAGATQVS